MKQFIRKQLFKAGWDIHRQPSDEELQSVLNILHPVRTNVDLVRIGQSGDGGYLVPDDLDGIAACFSPGVSVTAHFEEQMAARGFPCFMVDASVDGPPVDSPLFHFKKKFLGLRNDVTTITLNDWVRECAPEEGDLLLQMDIEGAEWDILLTTMPEVLKRFRIIVAEFHDFDAMFDRTTLAIYRKIFELVLADFHLVHWHPNNYSFGRKRGSIHIPPLMEATFLRKDRAKVLGYATTFPHPLDSDNLPARPGLTLPQCWHR